MINEVKNLDEAIVSQAKGIVISINDIQAIMGVKQILQRDKRGANKVYIIPEVKNWDIKIELPETYAFYDTAIISKLRSVAGVSEVKEI